MNPKLVLSEKPEKIIQSQGSLQPVREEFFIIFPKNLAGISKMVFKQSSLKQGYRPSRLRRAIARARLVTRLVVSRRVIYHAPKKTLPPNHAPWLLSFREPVYDIL